MAATLKTFALTENFLPSQDGTLQKFLNENSKMAVRVDTGKLRRMDTMLVELLLCAAASWRKNGLKFQVTNLSAENEGVFMKLGITSDLVERSVAA
jgi:anti-anti-sigma regulatory factor